MQAGQKIIIASNGVNSQQTEELIISAVSSGNHISLKRPLEHDHSSHSLSKHALSGEMGLLDRSITVASSSKKGAFILIKENATAMLQNFECFMCGQVMFCKSLNARHSCVLNNQ